MTTITVRSIAEPIQPMEMAYKAVLRLIEEVNEEYISNDVSEALEELELRISVKMDELKNVFSCSN